MKKGDIWMPLYIADYLGDTTHLTTAQHGAYLLLLMSCWKRGATLPDDDVQLAQMARCDAKAWRAMRPVIAEFFEIEDGTWSQKRLTDEFTKAGGIVDKRRQAGKAGAAKRWASANAGDDGKPIANGIANACQTASQTDAPSQSPTPKPKTPEAAHPTHATVGAGAEAAGAAPPHPEEPTPTPPPEDLVPSSRRGEIAVLLRGLGVTCTYAHPTVCEWAAKGVTDEQLREAVQVARLRKPAPQPIPIAYLVPIVHELHERPVDAGGSKERDWAYIFGETDRRAAS